MTEATPKRLTATTNGCASLSAILVAVEAEAHKMANNKPAKNQDSFLCIFQKMKVHFSEGFQG